MRHQEALNQAPERPGLGTGWGESRVSHVHEVSLRSRQLDAVRSRHAPLQRSPGVEALADVPPAVAGGFMHEVPEAGGAITVVGRRRERLTARRAQGRRSHVRHRPRRPALLDRHDEPHEPPLRVDRDGRRPRRHQRPARVDRQPRLRPRAVRAPRDRWLPPAAARGRGVPLLARERVVRRANERRPQRRRHRRRVLRRARRLVHAVDLRRAPHARHREPVPADLRFAQPPPGH